VIELRLRKEIKMSGRGTEILKEALALPPGERAEIAERLLSSLDTPDRERVGRLWASEAEDRVDAYEQGEIETVPAREVFEQIGPKTK
jgi:putative addiction module component (TIGR02574 family)